MASAGRKYWSGISPFMGEHLMDVARRCEEQGLHGIYAGQHFGPPWVPLAAAAAVTRRLQLAAGIAIAGTPDEAREEVERAWAVAESIVLAPPIWGVSPECSSGYEKAIAETFYG